jgi:hypothetical protein
MGNLVRRDSCRPLEKCRQLNHLRVHDDLADAPILAARILRRQLNEEVARAKYAKKSVKPSQTPSSSMSSETERKWPFSPLMTPYATGGDLSILTILDCVYNIVHEPS